MRWAREVRVLDFLVASLANVGFGVPAGRGSKKGRSNLQSQIMANKIYALVHPFRDDAKTRCTDGQFCSDR